MSYSSAYCNLFYHFLFGLREATGIDLYRKAFFSNYGEWRLLCVPPNAYMVPSGDGRTNGTVSHSHADQNSFVIEASGASPWTRPVAAGRG